ncbi:hypothetical protein BCON_0022g00040 [Botryotinia convoluta]|uniref:Uncharacterized protein n=1 Tax=Botryotinia convoluta TaxID=54673 RepID=A0A4Z1IZL2_9HELO|nr:hypothetical protein BCON_0022g00040 [Botryotinia convoluta]
MPVQLGSGLEMTCLVLLNQTRGQVICVFSDSLGDEKRDNDNLLNHGSGFESVNVLSTVPSSATTQLIWTRKDSKEKSLARHHQHHHHHNHASTSTSASVINSDPATKGLTTKAVQSRTSKKYDHLHHESIGRLTCDRKEDSDAQHHHDHNASTTASTTSSTSRGQQQYEHHHYDNAFILASTSASTTSRSTTRSDQSSNSEIIFDPESQDEQLACVGSWMKEYDDSYVGNYLQEVDLSDTEKAEERERDG